MLGSSSHSHLQDGQNSQLNPPPPPPQQTADHHHHQTHIRDLLCCAQLISRSDFSAARRLISFLSTHSSPYGDSSDRLTHYFTTALSLRLHRIHRHLPYHPPLLINTTSHHVCNDAILKSSYLSLNQITPFIRFSHFTANQAILETIHQYSNHYHHPQYNIHILDFDLMHGVQWPPLMQTIADLNPPPTLRITSTGTDLNTLRTTGDRLFNFAHSLGLNFRFHPLLLPNDDNIDDLIHHLSAVILRPNEILAVNCVFYLHRMLKNRENLVLLLRRVKFMNPKVVTLAEREANHNHPLFVSRFDEALKYYTAVFESLEATLPANSRERMVVEEVWFGREIVDVVAAEGENRRERHERFRSWEVMMRSGGFRNIPVSPFAVAQGKLLLRLHYPCEGYNLEVFSDFFFLGWRNQPLFSVSSWC